MKKIYKVIITVIILLAILYVSYLFTKKKKSGKTLNGCSYQIINNVWTKIDTTGKIWTYTPAGPAEYPYWRSGDFDSVEVTKEEADLMNS